MSYDHDEAEYLFLIQDDLFGSFIILHGMDSFQPSGCVFECPAMPVGSLCVGAYFYS
jgi:hypothetical protein